MRSCCKQVKDFLEFGKHLHGEIKRFYDRANEETGSERIRMLLDYLSRHEQHLEESLARFEKGSRSGILNTWLEYPPDLDVEAVIGKHNLGEINSSEALISIAMDFDDTLVALYREVSAKVDEPKLKEVFLNLLALEEKEKIQVLRAAMSFQDM
ncbi:hypothetical protein SAMN02949497_2350 [Methylomagnum ishizawai]|uniref:Rubrerythrin n=1 Tax=Methylomagnum ishizawai TaxID=1760988 RepID=A0A1Y6CXN4_9GAMM|nr:hypothetical protein [Methylomagnum ishizawai]SMF95010.1 hypothetical protein SAMN02949497_2350 [Methylomagnum ishizawai]